jgi:hypothetical protein
VSGRTSLRLVDDYTAKAFKFNGREPRTLEELAVARADYEHRRRLAEIKAISSKLAQLEVFLPELMARGTSIHLRNISTCDAGKSLWIESGPFPDNRLQEALLALGFKELERRDWYTGSRDQRVTLKHARLVVVITAVKPAAKDPAPAAADVAA